MQFVCMEIQAIESPGGSRKGKQFDIVRDDIEVARGRRGRFSQHFLPLDVIIILRTNCVWSFRHVLLFSYDYSNVT
jgi:hypothetical protein